jgi:hypothetical protein
MEEHKEVSKPYFEIAQKIINSLENKQDEESPKIIIE